jgi:hypothetical protein
MIACLEKNYFLVVVSFLVVSVAILEESVAILEESELIFEESEAILEESVFASVLALLLQAAKAKVKAPIDNTNKNFFICDFFLR